ncbi:ParM/StbA family protein [Bacillus cytotoxicus]|uniref:ParM/StbA family protein n=1 Tax=unclassified Bacillus cereus group TaxID=2750818 RepID=UPI001F587100|nr:MULTISPECIES: ParM/StbA family protein [unclassified Bacillus cereus group]EMA6342063.1 ParM/StbA family protein [Bacillus cytotoxicus]
MKSLYAIDAGIGFTKRAYRRDDNSEMTIKTEASTLAPVSNRAESTDLTKVSFIDLDFAYYMGKEAHQSDASFLPPFEEEIENYYESERFKQQIFGCIAKDYKENVVLPLVVTGLPLTCFGSQHEQLQNLFKKETSVQIDGKFISIAVENTLILQQPVALQAYFLNEGIIHERDRILIIDGGFRTLEMTDMKQHLILNHYEAELGCSKPLQNIKNMLQDNRSESNHLHINDMPDILEKEIEYGEESPYDQTSPISSSIQKELDEHFQDVMRVLQEKFKLDQYDAIIWTGGIVDIHQKRIKKMQGEISSVRMVEASKEAALHGYYIIGCQAFEDITKQSVYEPTL